MSVCEGERERERERENVCVFRICQLSERAVRLLEGERTGRAWVKVVSMATAALKSLSRLYPFHLLPAVMASTVRS